METCVIYEKTKKISTKKLIEAYHKYFEIDDKVEYDQLPQDLIRLRNHVLFIHNTIESLLHFFICGHITPSAEMSLFAVQPVLDKIDYARLVPPAKNKKSYLKKSAKS